MSSISAPSLAEVEDMIPRFQAVKEGREAPRHCGNCPYCRAVRKLTTIENGEDPDGKERSI